MTRPKFPSTPPRPEPPAPRETLCPPVIMALMHGAILGMMAGGPRNG